MFGSYTLFKKKKHKKCLKKKIILTTKSVYLKKFMFLKLHTLDLIVFEFSFKYYKPTFIETIVFGKE